ncbi:CHROMATIN TARGET OF PRMT1 PROTEIN-RELATED [Salix koriyanagi]|uniref:CHROMATIN TARGET OF PRMT1 PROTEIN-RELATED n=1 Tax=Salix koriyanagi TaxID=2511006 RepID=A0A9Q0TQC6_9ROSI|nr:CHROMATIN TARGET OF PRMT1 PROTEIN-RELATED [Salix koriyanagi]
MSNTLDMSLDDIIKNSKKSGFGNSRGRGRGRPSGAGPARRFPIRAANRAAPYTAAKAPESTWQQDMFRNQSGRASSLEGNKLYVSNLDYGVSNIGHQGIVFPKEQREIVFSRPAEAAVAVKRYDNVQLDGKPMKIEIVGTNFVAPRAPPHANAAFGNFNGLPGRCAVHYSYDIGVYVVFWQNMLQTCVLILSLVANVVQLCPVAAELFSEFLFHHLFLLL